MWQLHEPSMAHVGSCQFVFVWQAAVEMSGSMQVSFGTGHQLWEVNCFLPFSTGLAFGTASTIMQAATANTACHF